MTGFESKREAAADKLQEPVREALKLGLTALKNAIAIRNGEGGTILVYPLEENAITAIKEALAQPPQRQWIWLSDADIAEVVDTTCQYSGGYEAYLIKKAERKIRSMNA